MDFEKYYEEYAKQLPLEKEITLGTKKRFAFVLSQMKEPILDVGCSHGYDLKNLHTAGLRQLFGIEIAEKVVKNAQQVNGKFAKFFTHNIVSAPTKQKFATIYSFDVIEHVFETNDFVKNIFLSLEDDGKFIVTTPNVLGLRNRINFLLGNAGLFIWKHDNPHIRFFNLPTLLKKLEEHGFKEFKIFKDSKIPFLPATFCGSITVVAFKKKQKK